MKRILKFTGIFFTLLTLSFFAFFYWASSPTMKESMYFKLITKNYPKKTSTDSTYSILTYNIGYLSGMANNLAIQTPKELYDANLQKALSELKKINPDIIAFQEIDYNSDRSYNVNQQYEIAKLGYRYIAEATNWDETYLPFPYWPPSSHFGKIHSGQSILSKYPCTNCKRIVLKRVMSTPFYRDAFYLERLAQICIVQLDNQKEIALINVHLEAFDKPTRVQQYKQIIQLFNTYRTQYPTILLGDFNSKARDNKAVIQQLFTMDGVGNAAFTPENPENTFNSRKPSERIDYIFYTQKDIEYVSGKIITALEQTSDHLPVLMKFKMR